MALTRLKEGGNAYRAEMDAHERASRDEIMVLQKQRLAWSLKHAYDNVAHYRQAFDKAGVHPSDFRELSDLAKFPFTVNGNFARSESSRKSDGCTPTASKALR